MKHKITAEKIFFSVAIFNICIVYILLIASKGQFIYALTYDESNFCDFWNHVKRLLFEQHIYTSDADAIFPPLAYLFLKMFAYPLKYKAEAGDDFWSISQHGYGTLMVVMYLLLFAWLLMIAVHIYYKTGSYVKESALLGILFFSYLIWGFAFERGNLVLYTTVFLMFGLALRDSLFLSSLWTGLLTICGHLYNIWIKNLIRMQACGELFLIHSVMAGIRKCYAEASL